MPLKIKPILLGALVLLLIFLGIEGLRTVSADESDAGSTIAGVKVAGLDEVEMKEVLQQAIDTWVTEPIAVRDGEYEVLVDPSEFVFDLDGTVKQYQTTVNKPWFAFWESDRVVHLPLQVTVPDEVKNTIETVSSWDAEATLNSVATQASFLKEHEISPVLTNLTQIDNERIALSIEEIPTDSAGVFEVVDLLNGTILYPGETFSFIAKVGESSANNEAKNFVASLLYDVVLNTEERHSQEKLPTYLEPGINAKINIQYNEDLKFLNSSTSPVQINATVEGSSLKVEIFANEKTKDVLVQVSKEDISPRIINRYSEDLSPGQEQLVQEGANGVRVIVTRIISESGSTTEEQISRDYYAPTNRIVMISASQSEQTSTPDTTGTTDENGNPIENTETPGTTNPDTNTVPNDSQYPNQDPDTQIDLDNNGLPDMPEGNEEDLPEGSYYDKGGNLITP
ncbi:VanW family protein [Lysinibacillus fusiformis]|nr:VanW family protein [Lysinibacillus fusiformis]